MMRWLGLLLSLVLIGPLSVSGQDLVPFDDDFQVNQYTTGAQALPEVATRADGTFTVVWVSEGSLYGPDVSSLSIEGQCFAADRTPTGFQFQANAYVTGDQAFPRIGTQPNGAFVVIWESPGSSGDTSSTSVLVRRFSSDCSSALGAETLVNEFTTSSQGHPALGMASDGGFVVVWESYGSPGADNFASSIQGRLFASDGSPSGGQFQVNTYSYSYQILPTVDVASNGDFVVAWQSASSDGGAPDTTTSIRARRFASDGTPQGDDFQVNTFTLGVSVTEPWYPSVGVEGDGDFIVVWSSEGSVGADVDFSIQGQRFASDGMAVGGQFQVNELTTGSQLYPKVSVDSEGDFLVTWQSDVSAGTDTAGQSIAVRFFDSAGGSMGNEFQVNSYTTGEQGSPTLHRFPDDQVLMVWDSSASGGIDSKDSSVQARFLATDTDQDSVADVLDNCPTQANVDQVDSDMDGSGDPCDVCVGDDGFGDGDADMVCADQDCDDGDPEASSIGPCGICGGDGSTCRIFSDSFESGDATAWSSSNPPIP